MFEKRRSATGWLGCQGILLAMGLLLLLSALSGCGSGQNDVGQANGNSVPVSLSISMPQESAAASTSGSRFWATVQSWLLGVTSAWAFSYTGFTLTVEVTGPDLPSMTGCKQSLDNHQSGDVIKCDLDVPVGPDRLFIAHVFDNAGIENFKGQSTPTTLTAGQAASVDVILIDITTGTVTGTVTNAGTGTTLSNATVAVNGTSLRTTTNSAGDFRLDGVPQGPRP